MPELLPLVAIAGLMALSGFFSGSETALTAVSRARMHALEKDGDARAGRVQRLREKPESLIGAILLGNNLVNILATAIATVTFTAAFGDLGAVYATFVMTALVLIFAEVLPKTYAISNADRMAMAVASPIGFVVKAFAPLVAGVQVLVSGVLKGLGVKTQDNPLSLQDELRGAIDLRHQEGEVDKEDRDMLGGLLDLQELTVVDVMVHRKSMEVLDMDVPAPELISQALESRYTRLPLWSGDPDNIIGVLHAKDLSRALYAVSQDADGLLREKAGAIDVKAIAREPWFVPETKSLLEQLHEFREKREHFALVVDEYGVLMGLVTLEDILEEIVGEIEDEHDQPVEGVQELDDGAVMVQGSVTIRDLNRAMDWNLPDEEAVTVAGLVIHEAQTIPERGQIFSFHGRRFEILARQRNQITQIRITPAPPAEDANGDGHGR